MTITKPNPITKNEEFETEYKDDQFSLGCGVAVLITTSRFNVAGIIQDIQPHAVSILVKHAVPPESEVSIEFGAVSREGKVVSCRPKGRTYELCVVVPNRNDDERRADQRFPVTQEVQVGMRNLESPLSATVVDLSTHGIGLETSTALDCDEIITVESDSNVAFGVVRYCRRLSDDRFQAGVDVFHVMPKDADECVARALPVHTVLG
jgi:PilZ domain